VTRRRLQQFLHQLLPVTTPAHSWDCKAAVLMPNLKTTSLRRYECMFCTAPLNTHNTLKDELLWVNHSILLSQPRNAHDRKVALHLPIVRKNCLGSIVLKQKSIAFGGCPHKFNEFIFNDSIQQGV
jgi:hypothetical protein